MNEPHLVMLAVLAVASALLALIFVISHAADDQVDDFSPLLRDPKPGERRIKYGVTQWCRALLWPVALAYGIAVNIPSFIRFLIGPMEENSE